MDPLSYTSGVAGRKNFRPIDYQPTSRLFKDSKHPLLRKIPSPRNPQAVPFAFNPDNFYDMCKDLDEKKTVMIAAHTPSHTFEIDRGGVGAVYLAQISDAALLPTAVRLSERGPGMSNIPNIMKSIEHKMQGWVPITAELLIGEPIILPPIQNIDNLKVLTDKQKRGEVWTEEETGEYRWLTEQLRWQSEFVQSKITELYEEQPE